MTTTRRSTLSRPFSRRNKTLQGTGKRRRLFFETLEDRRVLAVSVLGSAASTGDNLTTETISGFTVPAGNDLALVVLGSGYGSLNSVNAFGGQAFSSVGTSSDALGAVGSLNTSIWIALLGDRGSDTTADVVGNWTIDGDNEWKRISAIALSGVDQANPTSGLISGNTLADPHTLNVTSQVGDLVVDAIATGFAGTGTAIAPTVGANQTSLFSVTASGADTNPSPPPPPTQVRLGFAASYELGTAATAMSWSGFGSATDLAHVAVNINQAITPVPSTTVSLSSGTLTINDDDGVDNNFTLSYSGGTYTLTDPGNNIDVSAIAGAAGNGTDTVTFPDTGITSITVNGNGGNDSLTVDFTGGNPLPAGGISFDGGAGGNDSLVVTGYSLTTADGIADVAVTHLSSNSGTVTLAGLGTISFDEIEPLILSGDAADLVITLPAGADSITLGDDGGPQDANGNTANTSAIYDSTGPAYSFEFTEFTNPTNSLTIHRGSAADDLTVLDLVASGFAASLTIGSAGSPFDQVTFSGPVTLGADKSLTAHASGTISLSTASSDLATSGTGSVSLTTALNITLASGSSLTTVNGGITLEANQQMTPTAGSFVGIDANNSLIQTTGTGNIELKGRGGNSGTHNHGVHLHSGTSISSTASGATAGTITIDGTGGNGTDSNGGVVLVDSTTKVTSVDGDISITGIGNGSLSDNYGVWLQDIDTITSTGTGASAAKVTIHGTGGNGTVQNRGVYLSGSTTDVTSVDGDISITGIGGNGSSIGNLGVWLQDIDTIASTGTGAGAAKITIHGTGGSGTNQNHGVFVSDGSTQVASVDGAIDITGISQGTVADNNGVYVFGGVALAIEATGSAPIDITGNGTGTSTDAVTLTSVTTNDGTIEIDAGGTMTVATVTAVGSGRDVRLTTTAGGDIVLGSVTAEYDKVLLQASGAIMDGNGAANNANASSLAMTAGASIGAGNAIETTVSTLAASAGATATDHIEVTNTGNLTIGSATAFSATVTGVTGGGYTIITALSALTVAADVTMGGSVLLTATDSVSEGDNLTVNSGVKVESTGGTVELRAGDNMTLADCSTVTAFGTITLRGDYGNADPGVGSTMMLLGTLDSDGSLNGVRVEGDSDADTIILNPGQFLLNPATTHFARSTKLDGKGGGDLYQVYMGRLLGTTGNGGVGRGEHRG
jgi:hypothetical protein